MNRAVEAGFRPRRLALLIGLLALLLAQFGGCYYAQAVSGQLEVLRKREPILEVVEDPAIADETKRRLRMVLEARQFAVDELGLPDNDSYRTYADLEREYVVWNVFAAPEFSLEPKTWCFPVVGCVAYRGYFAEAAAVRHADRLADDGYDVHVGGVPAYSTLGRFDDPVLNTMLRWSDVYLVETVFHELAHQELFIKGDTGFNESFATAVAEAGLDRWLKAQGREAELTVDDNRDDLRETLNEIVSDVRERLLAVYDSDLDVESMREQKRALLDELSERAGQAATGAGFAANGWWQAPLNNARLSAVTLYRGHVDAFRTVYLRCDQDFACLYSEAKRLGALEPDARQAALESLAESANPAESRRDDEF